MEVQCWSATRPIFPSFFAMNWGNCTNPNPAAPAWEIARRAKFNPKGVPFLWNAMHGFLKGVTPAQIIAGMPNVQNDTAYFTSLYKALLAVGIKPRMIIADIEESIADWNWLTPASQLQQSARNTAAAERAAMVQPLHKVFNDPSIPLGGTGLIPLTAPVVDPNGWPYPPCGADGYSPGGVTSLQLYITSGNFFTQHKFVHEVEWNQGLIQNLNNIGACFGGTLMPWISYPSFGGKNVNTRKYIVGELIRHLYALHIETLLYWNPPGRPTDDDAFVAQILAELNTRPPEKLSAFKPTDYDSDQVVTGAAISKYSDFLKAKALDE